MVVGVGVDGWMSRCGPNKEERFKRVDAKESD